MSKVKRWILGKIEAEVMIVLFKLKAIIFPMIEIETMIADTKVKAIIVEMKERLRRWASSWPPFWCE